MSEIREPSTIVTVAARRIAVTSGDVSLDEMRVPYASGTLRVPLLSATVGEAIDPRDQLRAVITAHDKHTGQDRTFDLALVSRSIVHAPGGSEVALTVASDEALLQAWAPLATDTGALGLTTLRAVIAFVLGKIGATLFGGPADASLTEADPDALVWDPGVTGWDFLRPLLAASGLRLYCDEKRVWRLIDPATYATPGSLAVVAAATTQGQDTIDIADRDIWCTGVVVTYRWEDAAGQPRTRHDVAGIPGQVYVVTIDRPWPGHGAAAAILRRRQGQGRQQTATVFADWTATPGQSVSIAFPGAPDVTGRVSSAAWGLTNGLMNIRTHGLIETA